MKFQCKCLNMPVRLPRDLLLLSKLKKETYDHSGGTKGVKGAEVKACKLKGNYWIKDFYWYFLPSGYLKSSKISHAAWAYNSCWIFFSWTATLSHLSQLWTAMNYCYTDHWMNMYCIFIEHNKFEIWPKNNEMWYFSFGFFSLFWDFLLVSIKLTGWNIIIILKL